METTDFKDLAAPATFMRPFLQEGRYACYENAACEFDDEDEDGDERNGPRSGHLLEGVRHVVMDGYEGDGDNDSDEYGDGYESGSYSYHDLYGEDQDGDGGAADNQEDYTAMYGDFSVQELHEFMLQQQQQSMLDYAYSLRRYSLLETIHEETLEELRSDSECRSEVSDGYSGVWCWGDDFTDGAESVIFVENPPINPSICSDAGGCPAMEQCRAGSGEDLLDLGTNPKAFMNSKSESSQCVAEKPTVTVQDPSEQEGTWLDAESDGPGRGASSDSSSKPELFGSRIRETGYQSQATTSASVICEPGTTVQTSVVEQVHHLDHDERDSLAVSDPGKDSCMVSETPVTPGSLLPQTDVESRSIASSNGVSTFTYLKSANLITAEQQSPVGGNESDLPIANHQQSLEESHPQHAFRRTPSPSSLQSSPGLSNTSSNHAQQEMESGEFLSWSDAIDAYLMSLAVDQQLPLPEEAGQYQADAGTRGNGRFLEGHVEEQRPQDASLSGTVESLVHHRQLDAFQCIASSQSETQLDGHQFQQRTAPSSTPKSARLPDESRDAPVFSSVVTCSSGPVWRSAGVGGETVGDSSGELIRQVEGKSCQGSHILDSDLRPFDFCRTEAPSSSSWPALGDDDGDARIQTVVVPVRESSSSFLDEDESLVEFVGLENLVRTAGDGAEEQELLRVCTKFLKGDQEHCCGDSGHFDKQLRLQHRLSGIKSAPDLHDLDDVSGEHDFECRRQDFLLSSDHFPSLGFSTNSMEDYAQKSQSEPCVHAGSPGDGDSGDEGPETGGLDGLIRTRSSRHAKFSAFGSGGSFFRCSSSPLKRHSYSFGHSDDLSSSCQLDLHGRYSKSFDSQFSNDNSYRQDSSSSSDHNCSSEDEAGNGSVNSLDDGQGDGPVSLSRSRASLSLFPRFTPPGTLRSFRSFDTLHLAGKEEDDYDVGGRGCGGESVKSSSGHLAIGHSWMDGIDEEGSEREEKARPSSENLSEDSGFCDLRKSGTPHSSLLWRSDTLVLSEDATFPEEAFPTHAAIRSKVIPSIPEAPDIYSLALEDSGSCDHLSDPDQKRAHWVTPLAPIVAKSEPQDPTSLNQPEGGKGFIVLQLQSSGMENVGGCVNGNGPNSTALPDWGHGHHRIAPGTTDEEEEFETGFKLDDEGAVLKSCSCPESGPLERDHLAKKFGAPERSSPIPPLPLECLPVPLSAASCLPQTKQHPIRGDRPPQTRNDLQPPRGGITADGNCSQHHSKNEEDGEVPPGSLAPPRGPVSDPCPNVDSGSAALEGVPVLETSIAKDCNVRTASPKMSLLTSLPETPSSSPKRSLAAGKAIVFSSVCEGHQRGDAEVGHASGRNAISQHDLQGGIVTTSSSSYLEIPHTPNENSTEPRKRRTDAPSVHLDAPVSMSDFENDKEALHLAAGVPRGASPKMSRLNVTTTSVAIEDRLDIEARIQSTVTLNSDRATITRPSLPPTEELLTIESTIETCSDLQEAHGPECSWGTEFELQRSSTAGSDYSYLIESNVSIGGDVGAGSHKDIDDDDDATRDFVRTNLTLNYDGDRCDTGTTTTTTTTRSTILVTSARDDNEHSLEVQVEVRQSETEEEVEEGYASSDEGRPDFGGHWDFGEARELEGWARPRLATAKASEESVQQGGGLLSDGLLRGITQGAGISDDLIDTKTPTTPPISTTSTSTTPKTEADLEAAPFGTGRLIEREEVVEVEEVRPRRWQHRRRRSSTTAQFVDQKSPCSSEEEEEEESSAEATEAALNSGELPPTVYSAFTRELLERSEESAAPVATEERPKRRLQTPEEREEERESATVRPQRQNTENTTKEAAQVLVSGRDTSEDENSDNDSLALAQRCQTRLSGSVPISASTIGLPDERVGGLQPIVSTNVCTRSEAASGEGKVKQCRVVTFREDCDPCRKSGSEEVEEDPEMGERVGMDKRHLWFPYPLKNSTTAQRRCATGKPTDITTWSDKAQAVLLHGDSGCRGDGHRRPEGMQVQWEDQDEWFGSSIDSDPDEDRDDDGGDLQPRSAAMVAKIVGAPGSRYGDQQQRTQLSITAGDNDDADIEPEATKTLMAAARDYVTPGKPPLPPRHLQATVSQSPRQVATCRSKIINARQHFFTQGGKKDPPEHAGVGRAHRATVSSDDDDDDGPPPQSIPENSPRSTSDTSSRGVHSARQHHADVAEVLERFRQRAQEGRERIAKTVLDLSEVERNVRIQQHQHQRREQEDNWGIDPHRNDDESEVVKEIRSRGIYGWGGGNNAEERDRIQSPSIRKPAQVNGADGTQDDYKNGLFHEDDSGQVQSPFLDRSRHSFQDVYRNVADQEDELQQSSIGSQEQHWDSSDSDAPSSYGHHSHQLQQPPYLHDIRPVSPETRRLYYPVGSASSSPPATIDGRRSSAAAAYYGRVRRRSSATASWRGSNQSIGYLETDIDTLHSREVICVPDGVDATGDDYVDDQSRNGGFCGLGFGSVRRHYPLELKTQSMFNLTATDATGKNLTSGNILGLGGSGTAAGGDLDAGDAADSSSRAKSMEFLLKDENKAAILPPENRLQLQQAGGGDGGMADVQLRGQHGERVLSEHELRVRRSLQKLDLPEWYTSSPISQMGSTEGFILKKDQSRSAGSRVSVPRWEDVRSRSSTLLGSSVTATRSSTPATSSTRNVVISKRVTTPDFRYVKSSRESLLQSPMSPSPSPSPKDKSNYFQYCGSYTPSSAMSRWSSSRFSSTTASSRSTSPTGSLQYRSAFQRQPYLGWRSSERLARELTNSGTGESTNSTPTHSTFYRSAAERLSQGPGYYALRFGLYRSPGSDTNLAHRDGRRGSDISTATAPPCAMHTGSGDPATSPMTASVISEAEMYDRRPEIMVNVIEPNGYSDGSARNLEGRSSSGSSEQMQVADLVREIDKLINRNGQAVENGDVTVLQQQQQQPPPIFPSSGTPYPGLATDVAAAAEQKSQEIPVLNEVHTSPKTGTRQQMVWMESSFVGIRSIAPAGTPASEYPSAATTPTTTTTSSKDGGLRTGLNSDSSPILAHSPEMTTTTAVTSHVQVHPQPPTLFQTPSLRNQESAERRLSLNSTTLEEVLDSLLALPSSSQSPSPSGFRSSSKWDTHEASDAGVAFQRGAGASVGQGRGGSEQSEEKEVPPVAPKTTSTILSAKLPPEPVQQLQKPATPSWQQQAENSSSRRKTSSGTVSSSGSEVDSNQSSLTSSSCHSHIQEREDDRASGSSGTDLTTASTTIASGSSSYQVSDSYTSTGDSSSASGQSQSSISPSSSGSGKEVIPPPPDFTDQPSEVFYTAAPSSSALSDSVCTASFASDNAPSDGSHDVGTSVPHGTSKSFAPEGDTCANPINLCMAPTSDDGKEAEFPGPRVVVHTDHFSQSSPSAEQFEAMSQQLHQSHDSLAALPLNDTFIRKVQRAPPPPPLPQSDQSFETDYPETSTFSGTGESVILDSSLSSTGCLEELSPSVGLMGMANDVFHSTEDDDDDDEDNGGSGEFADPIELSVQKAPAKPVGSTIQQNHSLAKEVSPLTNISQETSSEDTEGGVHHRHTKPPEVLFLEGEKRRSVRSDTFDETVIVRCSHDDCKNTAELRDARKTFKTCHNCYTYYCSRECRKDHWLRHRRVCMYGRIRSMCKQAIQCSRDNASSLLYLSKLARTGYITQGRGFVKIVFRNTDLAIRFLRQGWPQLEDNPIYVNWRDLIPQEMGDEVYRSVVELCQRYDPDLKFVLLVAIFITREVPIQSVPHWEREVIAKCAKLGLSKFVGKDGRGHLDEDPSTLILTGPLLIRGADVASLRKAREVCLVNIQEQLRERGVILRQQFPEVYARLCSYVDNDDPFPPLTIYPKDGRTGLTFMCVITPNSVPQLHDSLKVKAK